MPIKWREPSKHFFACTDSRIDFAQVCCMRLRPLSLQPVGNNTNMFCLLVSGQVILFWNVCACCYQPARPFACSLVVQLGAFGGDVGEFALALAVLEHYRLSEAHSVSARTRYLSKDDVLYLLQSYLEASFDTHDQRLFTHCMDHEALMYLSQRSDVREPLHPKSQQEVHPSFRAATETLT